MRGGFSRAYDGLGRSKEVCQAFGQAPTSFRPPQVRMETENGQMKVPGSGERHKGKEPGREARLLDFAPVQVDPGENSAVIPQRNL